MKKISSIKFHYALFKHYDWSNFELTNQRASNQISTISSCKFALYDWDLDTMSSTNFTVAKLYDAEIKHFCWLKEVM